MFVIAFDTGPSLECSTAGAALELLRRGGGRLVAGSAEALLALDAQQAANLAAALMKPTAIPAPVVIGG